MQMYIYDKRYCELSLDECKKKIAEAERKGYEHYYDMVDVSHDTSEVGQKLQKLSKGSNYLMSALIIEDGLDPSIQRCSTEDCDEPSEEEDELCRDCKADLNQFKREKQAGHDHYSKKCFCRLCEQRMNIG